MKIIKNPVHKAELQLLSTADDMVGMATITIDTEDVILALTPTAGQIAYGTDTQFFYVADGTNWRRTSLKFYTDSANPDMGYLQNNAKDGYHATFITDKDLSNVRILENANTTSGSIRTTTAGIFQIYLNGKWNTVVINFVLREDSTYGYTFEHQPVGFTNYIEIMSGNSINNLGLNGLPITQGYITSMGAYPVAPILDGGTF